MCVFMCCSGVALFSLHYNFLVFSVMLWWTQCLWRLRVSAAVMKLGCINSADIREYEKSWSFDFRNHRETG